MSNKPKDSFPMYTLRLLTGQITAFSIALLMFSFLGMYIKDVNLLYILCSSVCIPVYFALMYSASWNIGRRDQNWVKHGYYKGNQLKPLIATVIASSVGYLLFVMTLLYDNKVITLNAPALFKIWYAPFYVLFDHFSTSILAMITPLLLMPIAAWLGYFLGYRQISILHRLMYKQKK